MSADNYLLVTRGAGSFEDGYPVFHLFASDEDVDLGDEVPLFIGNSILTSVAWANHWTRENVCEYGVRMSDDLLAAMEASA